jgi:hypothetical protein
VAERVRRAFERAGGTVAGRNLGATVSIGIASGRPGTDIVALLAAADTALYRAKANGRNRVEANRDGDLPILFATTRRRVPLDRSGREAAATRAGADRDPCGGSPGPALTLGNRFAPIA